jgi:anaphase-promoting complex subunit 1
MLALDTSECSADLKIWPEFHNGVAAGLRLPLYEITAKNISNITRTWIVYNRPPRSGQTPANTNTPNGNSTAPSQNLGHAHGGLLMALGLRGHLTTLEMTDIFDYLTQGSVTTTVGVLLGMAAK